jgi:hypothetical protein
VGLQKVISVYYTGSPYRKKIGAPEEHSAGKTTQGGKGMLVCGTRTENSLVDELSLGTPNLDIRTDRQSFEVL